MAVVFGFQPAIHAARAIEGEGRGHVQFGGHKGYALSMAAEFLGRIFTGANGFADQRRGGPVLRNQGVTFLFMRHDLLVSGAAITRPLR